MSVPVVDSIRLFVAAGLALKVSLRPGLSYVAARAAGEGAGQTLHRRREPRRAHHAHLLAVSLQGQIPDCLNPKVALSFVALPPQLIGACIAPQSRRSRSASYSSVQARLAVGVGARGASPRLRQSVPAIQRLRESACHGDDCLTKDLATITRMRASAQFLFRNMRSSVRGPHEPP